MREEPAPILVTNGTMLEYMMVRQVDAPIIQQSKAQKSLRWIVLDEAHTYVGSQAAELALQLRRVMTAFGVTPDDVRFVATSATIAGSDAEKQLKKFLSELSGIPQERIDVLDGSRVIPELEPSKNVSVPLDEIEQIPDLDLRDKNDNKIKGISPERFYALTHSPEARYIREMLVKQPNPMKLDEITERLHVLTNSITASRKYCVGSMSVQGLNLMQRIPHFLKSGRISSSVIPREYGLVLIKIAD